MNLNIPCRLLNQIYRWNNDYPRVCMKQCADLLCPCASCCTVCARLDVLKMSQCLFSIFATVFMLLGCTDDIFVKEQHHYLSCLTACKLYTCTFIFLFANSVLLAPILDQPSLCKIKNIPLHLFRCRFYYNVK